MNIQFDHISGWVIFILAPIITGVAIYFYYYFKRNKKEFEKSQIVVLSIFRFVTIIALLVLLASPVIKSVVQTTVDPKVVIGIDNSESMLFNHSKNDIVRYVDSIESLLSKDFEVIPFSFGQEIKKNDSLYFNEQFSDYSTFLSYINEAFYNQHLSQIILIGDGIYNTGPSPIDMAKTIDVPIHTIAIGDTTTYSDQFIVSANHNPSVFLNNSFQLDLEVQFRKFNSPSTLLEIKQGNSIIISREIQIKEENDFQTLSFQVPTNTAGMIPYDIVLKPVFNEENKENNNKRIYIKVHENKKRTLLLYENISPDLGVINRILSKQPDFDIRFRKLSDFDYEFSNYDIVCLYQLPSGNSIQLMNHLKEVTKPLLLINGPSASISNINDLNLGVKFLKYLHWEEAAPYYNPEFALFSLDSEFKNVVASMPPLIAPFSEIEFDKEADILLYQNLKHIDTERGLFFFINDGNRKIGFINGEGIWKWRMQEYLTTGKNSQVDALLLKTFQLLSVVEEQKKLVIKYDEEYFENRPIYISAYAYNDNNELTTEPDISCELTNDAGNQFILEFDRTVDNYQLALGSLTPGQYSFVVKTQINNNEIQEEGSFIVTEIGIEQTNKIANHTLLAQLAMRTNGKTSSLNRYMDIVKEVSNNRNEKLTISNNYLKTIIEFKWMMLVLASSLLMEWFLRKFWGSY